MTAEQWSQVVAASVVPVVAISAGSLLCLSFYNRLAYIVSRLRTFQRERLEIQEQYAREIAEGRDDTLAAERQRRVLEMLEAQNAQVIRQARLVRMTLLGLLGAIGCMTLCSLATGAGVIVPAAKYAAGTLFVLGMLAMLGSIALAMFDMWGSVDVVEKESRFVSELEDDIEAAADEAKNG